MIEPYQAVVLQANIAEPVDSANARETVRDNIWRQILLFRRFKFSYGRARIVALAELCTHGLNASGDRPAFVQMGLKLPVGRPVWEVEGAEEMAMLAIAANEFSVYVSGSTWEVDEHWPDLTFHTGFIISPEGTIILKQRMINCGLGNSGTSGMYTRLEEAYGEDGPFSPFPVVDTPIGRMGLCVGGDLMIAEATRVLANKGAEIIHHPMGERNMETSGYIAAMKRVAAFANQCYILSPNIGQYQHQHYREAAPANDQARATLPNVMNWGEYEFMGRSQIIDPQGQILAIIPAAGESATGASIDIERLRSERAARGRFVYDYQAEAYARAYAAHTGAPHDWEGSGLSRLQRTKATATTLLDRGVLVKSEGYGGEVGGGQFSELPALTKR